MTDHSKPFEVTPELLDRVYLENIRNNQVGGLTDGVTEEAFAEQTGAQTYDETVEVIESVRSRKETVAASAGQVVCGDCAEVIPCQHVGIGRNGKPYTRGY